MSSMTILPEGADTAYTGGNVSLTGTPEGRLRVQSAPAANPAPVIGHVAVTGSVQQLPNVAASGGITLQNPGANPMYIGTSNTVSSTTGIKLAAGGTLALGGSNLNLYYLLGTAADNLVYMV